MVRDHLATVRFFFKLAPHSKIQLENSTHFTWRITVKTDEINFAHFNKKRLNKLELLHVNRVLTEQREKKQLNLKPKNSIQRNIWYRVKDTNDCLESELPGLTY